MGTWLEKNARVLYAVIGGFMLLASLTWWLFFYEARYTFNPTPSSASITVDGAAVSAGQRIKLKPGAHQLSVTLNDFIPFNQTIHVQSGQYQSRPISLRATPHLQPITQDRTTGPALNPADSSLSFINLTTGNAERSTIAPAAKPTPPVALSPVNSLQQVDEWLWAPSRDLGLVRSGGQWSLYNFNRADLLHQTSTPWPDGVGSVSWFPVGQGARSKEQGANATQTSSQSTALVHFNSPSSGEQTLVETDPLHSASLRLADLRDSGIHNPSVTWVGAGNDVVLRSSEGRLWRFVLYTRSLTPITKSETVTGSLASPDGQMLLAQSANEQLFVIGIDGKHKRVLKETGTIAGAAWSPDSKALWLVSSGNRLTVERVVIATDTSTAFATAGESVGTLSSTLVTADEQQLVLSGSHGIATLNLVPVAYQPSE